MGSVIDDFLSLTACFEFNVCPVEGIVK